MQAIVRTTAIVILLRSNTHCQAHAVQSISAAIMAFACGFVPMNRTHAVELHPQTTISCAVAQLMAAGGSTPCWSVHAWHAGDVLPIAVATPDAGAE
jgi:hypothetical protein